MDWQRNYTGPPPLEAVSSITATPQLAEEQQSQTFDAALSGVPEIWNARQSQTTTLAFPDSARTSPQFTENGELAIDRAFETLDLDFHHIPEDLLQSSDPKRYGESKAFRNETLGQLLDKELTTDLISAKSCTRRIRFSNK